MPCTHAQTDLFCCRRFAVLKTPYSQLLVSGFVRLVRQCHAKTHISPVAGLHQGSSGLEHYISVDGSWTLWHVLENIADGTDGHYKRNSWTLDTDLRGLPLVCKVGLSLTVDNALEFGKYFYPARRWRREWRGSVLYTVRCWTMVVLLIFLSQKLTSPKKKALCLVGFYLLPWTRNWLLSLYGLMWLVFREMSSSAFDLLLVFLCSLIQTLTLIAPPNNALLDM